MRVTVGSVPVVLPVQRPAMTNAPSTEVTTLLRRIAEGCATARGQLAEIVYAELRGMAAAQLKGMRGHTLQPTALVHEVWLRLHGGGDFASRQHFLGVAAKAMRSVLIDHRRRRHADKRGGDRERTPLDAVVLFLERDEIDLLDLDVALIALEHEDPQLARLVELRFFSGMSHAEIAAVEQCSVSTVERGWRLARAFLHQRLHRSHEA